MCGIAGMYRYDGAPVQRVVLQRMAAALSHRGPDQEGIYLNQNTGLLCRRLKIIDLSAAAAQPMADESGRYHVAFNGEIYNFRRLRETLASDYSFFSSSDTEVILRSFQQYGADTWSRLNGMFAIAAYDAESRVLFLVRDHVGIKPLYYYQDRDQLLFASEIKALFASGLVPDNPNQEAVSLYLQLGYFPGTHTAYRNIFKLLPGHSVKIDPTGAHMTRYWSIRKFLPANEDPISFNSAAQQLEKLLFRSVEDQMISDVPIGAFLSGGIDSSMIVALMGKLIDQQVRTFTVGFSNMGYYDERPYAARISEYLKTEHHEFTVETGIEHILPKLVRTFDEPFADSSAIPTMCLAELARKHVTVALSGTGGDEIFGGYRKYRAANLAATYTMLPKTVRSAIEKSLSLLPASRRTLWQERTLLLQRFSSISGHGEVGHQLNSIFTSSEARELLGVEGLHLDFVSETGTVAENMLLFDCEYFLPEDLLVKEDRTTMAFGLEARVPYLDRELMEFMTSLPLRYKVTAAASKKLFRKVAASHLPGWILRRPKHGFGSPVAEWLRTDLRSMAEELFTAPESFQLTPDVRRMWEEHIQSSRDHSRRLWVLLMLELWQRNRY